VPASGPARRSAEAADAGKRPLAERINDPRVARFPRPGTDGKVPAAAEPSPGEGEARRGGGFLKPLDAASLPAETRVEHAPAPETPAAADASSSSEIKRPRKTRLLDRITGLDKNSA
jgi:hypothetical protein